jgi:hypothetical protein
MIRSDGIDHPRARCIEGNTPRLRHAHGECARGSEQSLDHFFDQRRLTMMAREKPTTASRPAPAKRAFCTSGGGLVAQQARRQSTADNMQYPLA